MARPTGRPIREELIDAACTMVQRVGVNSFSYRDLADQLEISTPSIHHHFRTKDELVAEVAARYRANFTDRVSEIEASTAADEIRAYAELFVVSSSQDLMCFCGSVASDWFTVGERARAEVLQFFDDQTEWLTQRLIAGDTANEFKIAGDPVDVAIALLASLEGSLLMSRVRDEGQLPATVTATLLTLLG